MLKKKLLIISKRKIKKIKPKNNSSSNSMNINCDSPFGRISLDVIK